LKFSFVFSWSLGYQTKKIRNVKCSSYQTSKEITIIFVKVGKRNKEKKLKE
jgi:hypothetical protein